MDFKEKLVLGYIYPKIKNHKHGENISLYVRDYLISKKYSKFNPKYPDYINENEDTIDTQKRYFSNIDNKYEPDINNDLFIKYYPDKKKENMRIKKVPFTKNLKEYLLKIHSEDLHRNALSLKKSLLSRNIFYYGITEDTINFIKECSICNIKINYKQKSKREITKLIIFKKQRYKYIGDLSDIPNEIKVRTKFLYIFIIIDHFSKFLDAFLLENKKQETILKYLDYFCKFYGYPIQFGCDNGREFINEYISNYLIDNNITMINGKPYKTRGQSGVELVYLTIRNGLIVKYIENDKNFNLEESLKLVVNNYNRTLHSQNFNQMRNIL